MAVTKIHPIKSTLKKALDYIENPDKTYDKMLVSSFACSYETADIEFEMLLAQAASITARGKGSLYLACFILQYLPSVLFSWFPAS